MQDTFHVKGLSALGKALATLAPRIERNVLRGALRAGMKPVQLAARSNAAKATGALAKGLRISTDGRKGKVYARLKTSGKHDYIARFVEFGTAPHTISGRNGGMLRIAGGAIVPSVAHPGARAVPFMRPAIDTQAEPAVQAVANYIRNRLATQHGIDIPDTGDAQ